MGLSYTTTGYGLRLGAILKLIAQLSPSAANSRFGGFILAHIDIAYDHASTDYYDQTNPNNGVTFNGLSLVIR